MSEVNEILCYGHPVLRRKAARVRRIDGDVQRLIERMRACLERAGGLGLAAPQIGAGLRVMLYDIGEGPRALINPSLERSEGLESDLEGCLSLPGLYGNVPRATRVVLKGRDAQGRPVTLEAQDLLARILQHELDHLDGILFVDRVEPETLHWLVGDSSAQGEPARVPTTIADALKVFEARSAAQRDAAG